MLPLFHDGHLFRTDNRKPEDGDYVLADVGTKKLLRQLIMVNGQPKLVTTSDDSPDIEDFTFQARVGWVGFDLGVVQ